MAAVRFEQAASTTHATPVDVAPPKDGVRAAAPISAPISAADEAGVERRVRIVLERALQSAACGGCAALWREYLRHELRMGRQEAVGRVHLRAVQQCPGVKGMWTQGLQLPLAALLPAQQLVDILQLMSDKEIRLRQELPVGLEPLPSLPTLAVRPAANEASDSTTDGADQRDGCARGGNTDGISPDGASEVDGSSDASDSASSSSSSSSGESEGET